MPKSGGVGGLLSSAVDPDSGQLNLLSMFSPERLKSNDMRRKLLETEAKADQEDQEIRSFMSAMGLGEQVQGKGKATQQAAGEFLADRGGKRKAEEIKAAGGGGLQGALDAGKAALREQQIAGVSTEQIEAGEARREFQASVVPRGTDPTEFAALTPEAREEVRESSAIAGAQQHFAQQTARVKGQENRRLARFRKKGEDGWMQRRRELGLSFGKQAAGLAPEGEMVVKGINEDGSVDSEWVETSPGGTGELAKRLNIPQAKIDRFIALSMQPPSQRERKRKGKGKNRVHLKPGELHSFNKIKGDARELEKLGVLPGPATMAAMYTEMGPERMLALPRADEFTDGSNEQMAQAIVDRLGIPAELIKAGLIQDIPKNELNALIEMMMTQLGVGGDDDRHALRSVVIQKLQQARL